MKKFLPILALLSALTAHGQISLPKSQHPDTLSYCSSEAYYYNAVGSIDSNGTRWGACFPPSALTGRHYLTGARLYIPQPGTYSLMLYQGGIEAPQTHLDSVAYRFDASVGWMECPLSRLMPLDTSQSLWVVFHNNDVSAPAAYCIFTGDSNSSLIYSQNQWNYLQRVMSGLDPYPTWLIAALTANHMDIHIHTPSRVMAADSARFSTNGPDDASYQWTFEGASPATATGRTVATLWEQTGTYSVNVTAIYGDDTVTAQTTVEVFDCSTPHETPFTCGFEPEESLVCWTFVDADGDGNGWNTQQWAGVHAHTGEGVAASASRGNNVFNPALHPDNWMISPEVSIPASGATLSWWAGSASSRSFAEYYSVLVSSTGSEPAQFTHTLYADSLHSPDYQHHTASLAAFAGQTVRIAFRHHNCASKYWLLVDDIEVNATVGIDGTDARASFRLYPNPTTGLLHIDGPDFNEVCVTDACGRQLLCSKRARTLDLQPYGNGVYFVHITSGEGTSIKKIVKH